MFELIHSNQKKLLTLAFPIIVGQLSHMIISISDAIMVGRLGYLSLAAASLMISILSVPMFACLGFTYLISSLVAERRGRSHPSSCFDLLANATFTTILLCLAITILFTLGFKLIYLFGQDPQVIKEGKNFFLWILWSLVPMIVYICIKQYYDGLELTKVPMLVSGFAIFLNLLLNFIFIYGLFGFKAYGLEGSGIATFVTRMLMMFFLLIHMFQYKKLYYFGLGKFKLKFSKMKDFLKLALPSSWQYTSEVAAFAVLAILAGWYGPKQQAAHQIAITVASFSYVIFVGLSSASSIKIGESLGKNDYVEIKNHGKDAMKISLVFAFIMFLLLILFKNMIVSLFNTNEEVIQLSSTLLIFAAFFQFSDALQALGIGMLRGIQDVRIPTLYTTFAYWIIGIPSGFILAEYLHLKVFGIWTGFIICLSVSAFLLIWRFKRMVQNSL